MKQEKKYCNACGRELKVKNGILLEDVLAVQKEWGYFSEKDREVHEFYLCEHCYDALLEGFAIPVKKETVEEVL